MFYTIVIATLSLGAKQPEIVDICGDITAARETAVQLWKELAEDMDEDYDIYVYEDYFQNGRRRTLRTAERLSTYKPD